MADRRRLTPLVVLGTSALIAGTLAIAPAQASAGPTTSVTVLLQAPDPAALARLATATGLTHAQRMAALARLLPGTAAHRSVVSTLSAAGFTVGHETAWTVDASASERSMTAMFGAAPRRAAVLPHLPRSLAGIAAAVFPSTGPTGVFRPRGDCPLHCRDGSDFRNAYTAPQVPPATGQDSKATLTIATLQFAPWNDSDLTHYAASIAAPLGDPVQSGQYKEFVVRGAAAEGATTNEQGIDEEVDLDQETLLSTDPYAKQRAYFDTSDSSRGYVRELSQVLADVTRGRGASPDGGDSHIVALSTSWGSCEADFSTNFPGDSLTAIERVLQSLTAAGVTIFAASGDDGVYDCGHSASSKQIAVDYPASSPEVVGVGGTRLSPNGGAAANNGTNWSDKGWSCTSTQACEGGKGTGGSGGGESTNFPAPTYQTAGLGHDPFRTSTGKRGDFGAQRHRLVPDIAVDGDPRTGFDILTSDPTDACNAASPVPVVCRAFDNPTGFTTTLGVGGTSLSAPASAGLFTNLLAAHRMTHGVGDIHGALYSAYAARDGGFRDPTAGSNGRQQNVDAQAATHKAAELPVNARAGFDTVTGLGAPLWPTIAPYLFSPRSPRPKASLKLASPHSAKHPTRIIARWSSRSTGSNTLVAGSAHVRIREAGRSKAVYRRIGAPATGSYAFSGAPGGNYSLTVTDRDVAGRRTTTVMQSVIVPYDDRRFRLSGTWTHHRSHGDFGGSDLVARHRSAQARATAVGNGFAALVRTGPTLGKLAIFHGATRVKVIDLYSPSRGHQFVPFFGNSKTAVKRRTFSFRFTGRRSPFSTGTAVDVDALVVTR